MHEQRFVRQMRGAAPQDAGADQRIRVHIGIAQEFVPIRNDPAQRPRLESRQRRAGGVHFVGKHPQVAGRQTTVFAALQAQLRQLEWRRCQWVLGGVHLKWAHSMRDSTHRNRLAVETSPYLLQHAANPVDWHPWGEEALSRAQRENKPILLSIGYSACHWCHVMAHESFEDPATAAVMNELFVNVKVDREERPDLDQIYQIAQQMLTQRSGGWSLTMFLSPRDQRPFFCGTYFP